LRDIDRMGLLNDECRGTHGDLGAGVVRPSDDIAIVVSADFSTSPDRFPAARLCPVFRGFHSFAALSLSRSAQRALLTEKPLKNKSFPASPRGVHGRGVNLQVPDGGAKIE
jgi:hypothetical protein